MSQAGGGVRAAVVTVGDELLLGATVDTNAAWLGRELAGRGIPVVRRYTVGDEEGDIMEAVAAAATAAPLVVVTGGLGPTPDDLTRDAVAKLADVALVEDPEVLEALRIRWRARGAGELPENNRRVAQVPEGADRLVNPRGTAPGLALDVAGSLVVLLPGVPRELRGIVRGGFFPLLEARFPGALAPAHSRLIHTTGIPESALAQQVADVLPEGTDPVRIAFLPDLRGVDLRLTAMDMDADEAASRFRRVEEALAPVLDPWRFHAPSGDLAEAVVNALREAGLRMAVAESCTGGLVAKRVTDVPGASEVLEGGVVAYANEVKVSLLGVGEDALLGGGAVSEAVAMSMASGVARRLGTPVGVGVTGIAGPGGGTEAKPVGTVWMAAAVHGRVVARREWFAGDREAVRERAAQGVLFLLLRALDGRIAV